MSFIKNEARKFCILSHFFFFPFNYPTLYYSLLLVSLQRLTLRSLVQLQEAHKKESKKYIEKLKLAGGKIKSSNDSDQSDDDDDDTHASDSYTNSQNVTDAEEPLDMSDLTDSGKKTPILFHH